MYHGICPKGICHGILLIWQSKTAEGLRYSVNQEKYLKVFLTNGDVPMDNSASERSIRTFCIGKKNWMFHDSVVGAESSAIIYSISETAKLNNLRPYYYFKHLLTELPKMVDENGNMDDTHLDKRKRQIARLYLG